MKRIIVLTGFILLTVAMVCRAQTITLHKQNISLKQLFDEIRKQTGYDFLYNPQILAKAKPINVEAVNSPLKKVLDDCFTGQPLTYIIDEKTIIVKEKPAGTAASLPAITGKVINNSDKSPVAGASVFLSNGTIGANSNNDGTFKLQNVRPGNYDLVVSIVGFEPWHQNIRVTGDDINIPDIEIVPKIVNLKEVVIKPRNDKNHTLNYQLFKLAFLGTSVLADQCTIENPEALNFDYDDTTRMLRASSSDFLIIQNNALGYRIKYLLADFSCNMAAQNVSYNGSVLFEKLAGTPSQQRTWANRRTQVYEPSEMHFLRALLSDQLDEEGFRVLKIARSGNKTKLLHTPLTRQDILCKTDKEGIYAICHDTSNMYFEYSKNHHFHENARFTNITSTANLTASVLLFSCPYIVFDQNGWVLNPKELSSLGVWERYRVAGLLPADYQPFEADTSGYLPATLDTSNAGKRLLALKERSDSVLNQFPAEKVYLQTDKPDYMVGDTVWLKAWLFNAPMLLLSAQSGILHIDIADDSNKVVKQCLLRVNNGMAYGQLALDEKTFKGGDYMVRAYTSWMRNFGDETFFYKHIRIANAGENSWLVTSHISQLPGNPAVIKALARVTSVDKVPLADSSLQVRVLDGNRSLFRQNIKADKNGLLDFQFTLPSKKQVSRIEIQNAARSRKAIIPFRSDEDIDMQFMPGSGKLVAGLSSVVGFKAVGADGRGIDIKGTVSDKEGREVASFKSMHLGMGSFILKPQSGESYTAKVSFGAENAKTFALPLVKESGIQLDVKNAMQSDSVEVTLSATEDITKSNQPYFLIGKARGVICYAAVVDFNKGVVKHPVAKSLFPTSITHFIVTTSQGQPVCERLIYIDHHDNLQIKIQPEQQFYALKDSVALHIKVTDAAGQPEAGNFSLAVTDDAQLKADTSNTIVSRVLLTSDLRGYVEDPGYYLRGDTTAWHALDNLLLTQGWVSYEPVNGDLNYQPESGYVVKGIAHNVLNKGIKNLHVQLLCTSPAILMDTTTDKNGHFTFDHFPQVDTPIFFLKTAKREFNVGIAMDEPTQPVFTRQTFPVSMPWYVNTDSTLVSYMQASNKMAESSYYPGTGHRLKEVKITAKKVIKGSENPNGSGNADVVLDERDLEKANKQTFLELLEKNVKGFHAGYIHGVVPWYFVNDRPVLLFVDGIKIWQMYPHFDFTDFRIYLQSNWAEDIKGLEVISTNKYVIGYLRVHFAGDIVDPDTLAIIEITTRSGRGPNIKSTPGTYLYKPLALTRPKQFYKPRYAVKDTSRIIDLRSTIDWEPNVVTNEHGEATISFYAGSVSSTYTILVQGTDANGLLGFSSRKLRIEKRKPDTNQ